MFLNVLNSQQMRISSKVFILDKTKNDIKSEIILNKGTEETLMEKLLNYFVNLSERVLNV